MRDGDRYYIRVDQYKYSVDHCEAMYFEILHKASLDSTHVSCNMMKAHDSGLFASHPEKILKRLKGILPDGVVETQKNKGSRIAPEYLVVIEPDIEG